MGLGRGLGLDEASFSVFFVHGSILSIILFFFLQKNCKKARRFGRRFFNPGPVKGFFLLKRIPFFIHTYRYPTQQPLTPKLRKIETSNVKGGK